MNLKKSVKISSITAAASIIATMSFSSSTWASDEDLRFTMATEAGDRESPQGQAVKRIADLVEEQTDGRIRINVFYQDEIGGPQELFDQLVRGNIDLFLGWPQTSYDERLGVLQLPYLTLGWEDALKAYSKDGWVSEIIDPVLADIGLEYLARISHRV